MTSATDTTELFPDDRLYQSERRRFGSVRTEPVIWKAGYFLLILLLGLSFIALVDVGDSVNGAVKLIFAALLVLTLKRWTAAILLALVQAILFHLEQPFFAPLSLVSGLIWIGLTTSILIVVSRYRTLQEINHASVLKTLPQLRGAWQSDPADERRIRDNLSSLRMQTIKTLMVIGGCAIVASILLKLLPFYGRGADFNAVREFRLQPGGFRVIMSGLSLFVIFLPIWILVNEIVWRTKSSRQASVYLRSVLLKWLHRDLRMVARKRVKQRRKRLRSLKPTRQPDNPQEVSDLTS